MCAVLNVRFKFIDKLEALGLYQIAESFRSSLQMEGQ